MLEKLYEVNRVSAVLGGLSLIWIAAFLMTRITKKLKLPNVSGYIVAGVVIGPYVLDLLPQQMVTNMGFVTDAALTFIAFSVGKYLKLSRLKKSGAGIILLTISEAVIGGLCAGLAMLALGLDPKFCLLLGAIGSATAPASSIMTIRQYKAKGEFVDTLMQVAALDDAVALIAFSLSAALLSATGDSMSTASALMPIVWNIATIALGVVLGLIMTKLFNPNRSKEHRLAITCAFLFLDAAIAAALNVSPMLGAMAMGTAYMNGGGDKALFKQITKFNPPINIMFFVLSGMRLDLTALKAAGLAGVVYFIARIAGKYFGAYFGSAITHRSAPIRKYLGLALIPQAGVAIGLAVLGQRLLPEYYGNLLTVIILASSVLYELIGPACAKTALKLSGSIKPERLGIKPEEPADETEAAEIPMDEQA